MLVRYQRNNSSHTEFLLKLFNDPSNRDFFRYLPEHVSLDDLMDEKLMGGTFFLHGEVSTKDFSGNYHWSSLLLVRSYNTQAGVAEIGCCVDTQSKFKGWAMEAVGELCASLFFGKTFFNKLKATCLAENTRLRGILDREDSGFTFLTIDPENCYYDGAIEDEAVYYITREAFQRRYGDQFTYWKRDKLRNQAESAESESLGFCVGNSNAVGPEEETVASGSD